MSTVLDSTPARALVRVLVVEDSQTVRDRIRTLIEESGQATIVGESVTILAAMTLFREQQPDAVVLDCQLAGGTGYTFLEEIKRTRPACEVIILTNGANRESRERCWQLGADHFFEMSADIDRVPTVLAGVSRTSRSGGRILIADDEFVVGKVLKHFLDALGYECEWVTDAAEVLRALNRSRYELLIADINMPGNSHLELLPALSQVAPGLPVILLTGDPTVQTAAAAVRFQAKAYLQKPPDLAELIKLVEEFISDYRVHLAVRRKWEQFHALSLDLDQQLALGRSRTEDSAEYVELENMFRAVTELTQAGQPNPVTSGVTAVSRNELVRAVQDTIAVLEKTKRSFKSKQLGQLRERLESLVAGMRLPAAFSAALPVGASAPAKSAP